MALLQNISLINQYPVRHGAGYLGTNERSMWGLQQQTRINQFTGGGFLPFVGVPSGYGHPGSWAMALMGGGLASSVHADGDVTEALLANGLGMSATIAGLGEITNAALALIAGLSATISGVGEVVYAVLALPTSMSALVQADGGVFFAALGAMAGLSATLQGVGSVDANLTGTAELSAHIYVNEGVAGAETIAEAVWSYERI